MSFLSALLGWREILTYEVMFNQTRLALHYTQDPEMALELLRTSTGNPDLELSADERAAISAEGFKIVPKEGTQIAVRISPSNPGVSPSEHIRFWAHYQVKVLYNLGLDTGTAQHILSGLSLITASGIEADTDCIALVGEELGIRFVPSTSPARVRFSGRFYSKGAVRMIQTEFPNALDDSLLWLSGVGLLQAALVANTDDGHAVAVLAQTVNNLLELLTSRRAISLSELSQLPEVAYVSAGGAA
jgi:hypothetical protein